MKFPLKEIPTVTRNLTIIAAALAATSSLVAAPAFADHHKTAMASENVPTVGGAPMYPTKTIVENAVNSQDHTTLVAAVQAAGLVEALSGPGPFTVFAPTNAAFAKLPAGTVETLVKPENKETLAGILTYHVVSGRVSASELIGMIEANGGKAELTTLNGGTLTAAVEGGMVVLTDAAGGKATVTQADVFQSNGVIHVTDTVSLPG
ncbi:fasciclin domain-containing protein [Porphyrobacter sp. AAP60]|uniref:fasciclin domain-containing protein n=1 Tax=Porphyrobacter sp. AAP60 TaxID=1523423 RepID=UPI0009EB293A|nr:fasciclin domain-containing protein [Porphyrobacter sp. AAP60]